MDEKVKVVEPPQTPVAQAGGEVARLNGEIEAAARRAAEHYATHASIAGEIKRGFALSVDEMAKLVVDRQACAELFEAQQRRTEELNHELERARERLGVLREQQQVFEERGRRERASARKMGSYYT